MVVLQLEEQPLLMQVIFSGEVDDVRSALEFKQDVNYADCEGRRPLHAAAFKGDPAIALLLIEHGARVNVKDIKWITPLHRACCSGSPELVTVLLKHEADTSARDRHWQTPLHVASANNATDCILQLLNYVPNINLPDRMGRSALHHAALNGHNDVIELLLSKGCTVNAYDKKDCGPLHCAAHMGHVDTIELLLHYGADIKAKDRNQYTPLHVAAASGMGSACAALLSAGAQVNETNAYGNTPLHIACLNGHLLVCQVLKSFGADIEATNYRGQTPLHIAAASTHGVDCLNYLVEEKVNINKQSIDGRTPLHMTAIHGRFTRSKTLIDKGAIVECVDKNGCTALHIAAQYGHDLLSNTLLSFGASPSRKGYMGRTPVHMSCLSGYVECCRKFLQAGADLNSQDDTGKTPIHCAAYKGSVECLDLLVSNKANFQIVDSLGRLPLHYAAVQGHYPCVFTLVGLGSSVNDCDLEGCSALHLAAAYDIKGSCVEYLVQHKANPKLKDKNGFTPIHYAVAGNNLDALGYLLTAVGTNYDMYGDGMPLTTSMHLAARNGNMDILRLLLPYFHDTNIRTEHGSTALLLAARLGHTHCVQMLLRYGAKVSICDKIQNMGPVHYSAQNGHTHCLALLLDNAENKNVIDLPDSLQNTPLMLAVSGGHTESALTLLKCGANPNSIDSDRHSALFRAVVNGQFAEVQILISHAANVNETDINGKTVLHLAAACGFIISLQTLLKCVEPSIVTKPDSKDCTALHWACYSGNPTCVKLLLDTKIFKTLTGNPFSPLHCATFAGAIHCIELLCLHYGNEIFKLKDAKNRTPLHIASLHGHVECAEYLIVHGAEIDCKDVDGRTPLLAAAQNGQSSIIDILLRYKADVSAYDNNGNTALHLSCLKCHSQTALLLLENIQDVDIVNMINNDRKTPLHLSARNGLVGVTRHLLNKGSSVLAVDVNGMTPALCCAPNNNVAQCLAIILANYAICSQQTNKVEPDPTTNSCNSKSPITNKIPMCCISNDTNTDQSLSHTLNKRPVCQPHRLKRASVATKSVPRNYVYDSPTTRTNWNDLDESHAEAMARMGLGSSKSRLELKIKKVKCKHNLDPPQRFRNSSNAIARCTTTHKFNDRRFAHNGCYRNLENLLKIDSRLKKLQNRLKSSEFPPICRTQYYRLAMLRNFNSMSNIHASKGIEWPIDVLFKSKACANAIIEKEVLKPKTKNVEITPIKIIETGSKDNIMNIDEVLRSQEYNPPVSNRIIIQEAIDLIRTLPDCGQFTTYMKLLNSLKTSADCIPEMVEVVRHIIVAIKQQTGSFSEEFNHELDTEKKESQMELLTIEHLPVYDSNAGTQNAKFKSFSRSSAMSSEDYVKSEDIIIPEQETLPKHTDECPITDKFVNKEFDDEIIILGSDSSGNVQCFVQANDTFLTNDTKCGNTEIYEPLKSLENHEIERVESFEDTNDDYQDVSEHYNGIIDTSDLQNQVEATHNYMTTNLLVSLEPSFNPVSTKCEDNEGEFLNDECASRVTQINLEGDDAPFKVEKKSSYSAIAKRKLLQKSKDHANCCIT